MFALKGVPVKVEFIFIEIREELVRLIDFSRGTIGPAASKTKELVYSYIRRTNGINRNNKAEHLRQLSSLLPPLHIKSFASFYILSIENFEYRPVCLGRKFLTLQDVVQEVINLRAVCALHVAKY